MLSAGQMEQIQAASLAVLRDPGMRIMEDTLLRSLDKAGAKVDFDRQQVSFPPELVAETLASIRENLKNGADFPVLNGVVSSFTDGAIAAKFGGACCNYHDWESRCGREPTTSDAIAMLRLGEAIPEVRHVGNPVIYMREDDGTPIPPHLRPVKTAALAAKHTSKPYTCEVWSTEGLEFQIEIGCVVRGSWEAFRERPIFITAKETISPLQLPPEDARILMALAKRGLPATIIPMPLSGASSPVTPAANVAMANAEILGCFTALRCYGPAARVAGGVITGVMDMTGGGPLFAAPTAILQDRLLSQLFSDYHEMDLGIGTGYIDAACPGIAATEEKTRKMTASFQAGKTNYPVGILEGGKTFCPEQAVIDLELAGAIHKTFGGAEISDETLAVDVIREAGIGGNVLDHPHTLDHFRDVLHFRDIFGNTPRAQEDALERASRKWKDILSSAEPYALPADKAEEIDRIVEKAERFFQEKAR